MGKAVWGRLIVFFSSKGTDWRLQMIESFHYSVAGCVHALRPRRTCLSEIRRESENTVPKRSNRGTISYKRNKLQPNRFAGELPISVSLSTKWGLLKATCGLA